jgi:hypothetical protein
MHRNCRRDDRFFNTVLLPLADTACFFAGLAKSAQTLHLASIILVHMRAQQISSQRATTKFCFHFLKGKRSLNTQL